MTVLVVSMTATPPWPTSVTYTTRPSGAIAIPSVFNSSDRRGQRVGADVDDRNLVGKRVGHLNLRAIWGDRDAHRPTARRDGRGERVGINRADAIH